ncbi:spore cortex-lytic enzyme [Thalassobacillus devorans]|uniref:Spore cortex-lytic enzyme n=1 Tax=Thalassobacillus devorans TaxID=279813 RepID=A0ABQ1NWV9_9BACI|nr:cell wall hydrolase [Thalassobacillus devorans]NIK28629.1 N-acetylmuramoyl-L-alanine amidase [Thalassobacillus devorans]GGC84720.1 spore cortex-lytic enzyme [Thalassobacillus devorans]
MQKKIGILCLVTVMILIMPKELYANKDMLQPGDQGRSVTLLQEKLVLLGYLETEPTGYYGNLTEQGVRKLQQDFNLPVDGVVGSRTSYQLMEIEKMARVVHGEARGEPYTGKVAVAAVIKNRIHSLEFPSSIEGIIYQDNAFTPVENGQFNLTPDFIAYHAVKDAWKGWDPSSGSTYFYNPETATSQWIFNNTSPKLKIGKHLFAGYAE